MLIKRVIQASRLRSRDPPLPPRSGSPADISSSARRRAFPSGAERRSTHGARRRLPASLAPIRSSTALPSPRAPTRAPDVPDAPTPPPKPPASGPPAIHGSPPRTSPAPTPNASTLAPGRADQDCGASRCVARQLADHRHRPLYRCRLQHQVLRRIAEDEMLAQHHKVRASGFRLCVCAPGQGKVPGNITDHRIKLRRKDFEIFAHTEHLGRFGADVMPVGRDKSRATLHNVHNNVTCAVLCGA